MRKSYALFDEYPIILDRELAVKLGLNEGIFIQQLHYWLQRSDNEYGGKKWVYKTIEEWHEELKFFSPSTIKRVIKKLVDIGVIEKEQFSKQNWVRTNYYTIDYGKLNEILGYKKEEKKADNRAGQSEPIGEGQDELSDEVNLTQSYNDTETTTETTNTEIKEKKYIKKEFSFSLSKKQTYENLSKEYKDKLFAKIILIDADIKRYKDFILALEAKGYQYKNFYKAYLTWYKERTGYQLEDEPMLGDGWKRYIYKDDGEDKAIAINEKTLEIKQGIIKKREISTNEENPIQSMEEEIKPLRTQNRNILDRLRINRF